MKILIAPDKFKHTLNAAEVASAIREGVSSVLSGTEIETIPLADGGEGTLDALATLFPDSREATVQDALGREVLARFALSTDGQSALIETAQAVGLWRLSATEYDPIQASTVGVGQLIQAALTNGAKHVYLGLGGSATHDGGVGMLKGLSSTMQPDLPVKYTALCDVQTNLAGAINFAPQKGAKPDDLSVLEQRLSKLAEQHKVADSNAPFTGAAGGLGFGCTAFLGAELLSGAKEILSMLDVRSKIQNTDLVITGEGSFDAQTADGKLISVIAES